MKTIIVALICATTLFLGTITPTHAENLWQIMTVNRATVCVEHRLRAYVWSHPMHSQALPTEAEIKRVVFREMLREAAAANARHQPFITIADICLNATRTIIKRGS